MKRRKIYTFPGGKFGLCQPYIKFTFSCIHFDTNELKYIEEFCCIEDE
jgi:hypothetical protein